MKKMLSEIIIALLLLVPVAPTYAASDFTLAFDAEYSDNTLAGTKLNIVFSGIGLGAGQIIKFYQNDTEVNGSADANNHFTFTSLAGLNRLQAKIFDNSDFINPVAVSNELTARFNSLTKVKDIWSDDFESESNTIDTSKYMDSLPSDITIVTDEDTGSKVMQRTENADAGFPANEVVGKATTGYLSYQYKAKAENFFYTARWLEVKGTGGWELIGEGPYCRWDNTDPAEIVSTGGITRGFVCTPDTWHDFRYIFDVTNKTYDFYVDNNQVQTNIAFPAGFGDFWFLRLPKTMGGDTSKERPNFYLDDIKLEQYETKSVSLAQPQISAPVGCKISLEATKMLADDCTVGYYVNGVKSDVVGEQANVEVSKSGRNTAYAVLINANGDEIARSADVYFNGMEFNLQTVQTKQTMDSVGTDSLQKNSETNIAEILDLSSSTDAADVQRGKVAHLKVSGKADGNSQAIFNDLYDSRFAYKWGVYNTANVVAFSYDIKILSMEKEPQPYFGYAADNFGGYCGFSFEGEKLYVSTDYGKTAANADTRMTVPFANGEWHTLQFIFDARTKLIYHIVDGITYSVIGFAGTGKTFDLDAVKECFYPEFVLRIPQNSSAVVDEVYLDNVEKFYAVDSTELYKNVTYKSGTADVAKTTDIVAADGLDISFDVTNYSAEEKKLICMAAVYSQNGALCSIDYKGISLTATDFEVGVELEVNELPADISNGTYTVKTMIWNQNTLEPITNSINLPKE